MDKSQSLVLVAGATGGVGQLVVGTLLQSNYRVRVLSRSEAKARQMFGEQVEVAIADIRQPETLPAATLGVTHVICATGTTAFPSARWQFDFSGDPDWLAWPRVWLDADYRQRCAQNDPETVDALGIDLLVAAAPPDLRRFVFVSSCGVERRDRFPFSILNSFGVLDAKLKGETVIRASGLPYTIVRPARLIDGPYTSYDLNRLLKATTQGTKGIQLGTGDRLNGETSRVDVAAACVACLEDAGALNRTFELVNGGDRPESMDWATLFANL